MTGGGGGGGLKGPPSDLKFQFNFIDPLKRKTKLCTWYNTHEFKIHIQTNICIQRTFASNITKINLMIV